MRSSTHNDTIQFRANARLIAAARAKAERVGLSFSGLMRSALRRELAADAVSAFRDRGVTPDRALDPFAASLFARAAKGDLLAQREIRQTWFNTLSPDQPSNPEAAMLACVGLFVARLCAANGDDSDADMLAAGLLLVGIQHADGGRVALGGNLVAESLALFAQLSAAGRPGAAEIVDALVPKLPPELVEQAQRFARPREDRSDATADA